MAWNPPRTWATGEFLTAALLNEELRENLLALQPVLGEYRLFMRPPTLTETVIGLNFLECNGAAVSRSTYSDLYGAMNAMRFARGSGTSLLSAAMTNTQTTMAITSYPATWPGNNEYSFLDWAGFRALDGPFLVQIDSEKILVTSRDPWPYSTLTVVRGREGTLAASHNQNAQISLAADLPFGSGDGSTTFHLPDLAARAPWAAATGGLADVAQVGRHDMTNLASRRPAHRHQTSTGASSQQGSQVPFSAGTLGAGRVAGGHWNGSWTYQDFGILVGPGSNTPLDHPSHLVAGVWGIRFVGV